MSCVNIKNHFFHKIFEKVLTFLASDDIIYKQCGIARSQLAGMAELADARDLKSREIYFSYRFDPGFRHHYIAEWSSLVARRAHNPKVMRFKSHLRNQRLVEKRVFFFCFGKNGAVGVEPHDLRSMSASLRDSGE